MSNITPGHVRAFQAVRSQLYENVTLASCSINGEPGVAIVLVDYAGENTMAVMPLFVAITGGMDIRFPGEGDGSGDGGAPKNPREEFAASKSVLAPVQASSAEGMWERRCLGFGVPSHPVDGIFDHGEGGVKPCF